MKSSGLTQYKGMLLRLNESLLEFDFAVPCCISRLLNPNVDKHKKGEFTDENRQTEGKTQGGQDDWTQVKCNKEQQTVTNCTETETSQPWSVILCSICLGWELCHM